MAKKSTIAEYIAQYYKRHVATADKDNRQTNTTAYRCAITNADMDEQSHVDIDLHM